MTTTSHDAERAYMVEWQLRRRGVHQGRVLSALLRVPRHLFVPDPARPLAHQDRPLSLAEGQTISQPFMVARMTELLEVAPGDRVLEVGTGSGYQAAVLGLLAGEVVTMERFPLLAETACRVLERQGYSNVRVVLGDGSVGYPEGAPFDGILVAAAAPEVPRPLLSQLREGGRLVLPVGAPDRQELVRVRRSRGAFLHERLDACLFVPLIGAAGWRDRGPGSEDQGFGGAPLP